METGLYVWYAVSIVLLLLYAIKIIKWSLLWNLYSEFSDNAIIPSTTVSVVIAFRNEESNLRNLLTSLLNQNYPNRLVEFVLVNDHSEDNSLKVIGKFEDQFRSKGWVLRIINCEEFEHGKKAALQKAINSSVSELIAITDADCTFSADWLLNTINFYEKYRPGMITGTVLFHESKSLFENIQALEFLSLTGSGSASVIEGKPLMCNGANLMFQRLLFSEVNGYSYGAESTSGDDTFLMLKFARRGPGTVRFLKSKQSIVSTNPANSFSQLMSQRIRWIGKVKQYDEKYIGRTGLLVFLVNFIFPVSIAFAFLGFESWWLVSVVFLMKAVPDFLFMSSQCMYFNRPRLLLLFLPMTLIYPVYGLLAGWFMLFSSEYEWKGRRVKK